MRSILLVVLPYRLGDATTDTTKKTIRSFLAFPYGALTLASYLRRYSNNLRAIDVLDLNLWMIDDPIAEFECRLREMKPDIVGFSMSYDCSYPWLKALAATARREGAITVAGGPAITTAYDEILSECLDLDACCYSEGEVALKNLIDADDMTQALSCDPWTTRTKAHAKPVYDDLDNIIDVDYSLVDIDAYSMKEAFSPFTRFSATSRQFFIVTSRGCPFKCVFCAEPSFHGANMRYASVDRVVAHVSDLKERYGLNVLTIYDDQILMNKVRAKELFAKLAPLKIRIEMPNGVTLSYIDDELARLMKVAGVDTIFLAIEHGSKRVLHDIIKKPIAFNRIKPTIRILQDAGIFTVGFFVIGLPGETAGERRETRDAIVEWGLDWAFFNYATPLRGSELFRLCRDNKWIDEKYLPIGAIDMTEYVITAPNMNRDEIKRFVFEVNLDVNFRNNHNMKIDNFAIALESFREVIERHPTQPFAHYFYAQCLFALNRRNEGLEAIREFVRLVNASSSWYATAKQFKLFDEHRTAIRIFDRSAIRKMENERTGNPRSVSDHQDVA